MKRKFFTNKVFRIMGSYNIMLVDDEKLLIQCIELVLSIEGHEVNTATSAEEAFEKIKEIYSEGNKIDLLITDIWMPGLSGLDLIKKLHKQKIHPLIIGISGFTDDKTLSELYKKGCNDLVLKPFTSEELLERIHLLMEKEE